MRWLSSRRVAATRLQGGLQHLVYNKVLRLRASDEKALGQVVTFCSSEQERMFDAIHMSSITVGSPIMFAMAVGYSVWLMGPYALIGNLIILLFYPLMVSPLFGMVSSFKNILCSEDLI